MRCRSVLTRIDPLRTGELASVEAREVEAHLRTCASCHESVADVTAFAERIRASRSAPARSLLARLTEATHDGLDSFQVDGRRIFVAFSRKGIRMIDYRAGSPEAFRAAYRERFDRDLREQPLPARDRAAIEAALRGQPTRRPAVDLSNLTEFEQQVLHTILSIPHGEVRSYEWLARAVERPKAVRAVGNVMATNPVPFVLPCHRVVPTEGGIGGYAFGTSMKRSLLAAEGAPVEELEALRERGIRYIGSRTTKIFCFPTCRDARRIRKANRVAFHRSSEAREHGYRPCRRCAPAAAA